MPRDEQAKDTVLPRRVDVAVIGSGPAGASTALTLVRLGARVALLDRKMARPCVGESLPPAATPLLQDLGVWGNLQAAQAQGHRPAPGVRSHWGEPEARDVDFLRQPYSTGWHLDRGCFDAHLIRMARAAGALWCDGARVRALTRTAQGCWQLALAQPTGVTMLDAPILVEASGRARWLSRALGVGVATYDRLVATVATYAPGTAETDQCTLVEAVPEGWWYATPLPDGRLVVAHLSDADQAARWRLRTPEGWETLLRRTTAVRARVAQQVGQMETGPRAVSADSSHLATVHGRQWWAVGDAAAAHDPLSSQGVLRALEAGMRVGRAIASGSDGAAYAEWVRQTYAQYLARCLGCYALEQRWPAAPFWRRRHTLWRRLASP